MGIYNFQFDKTLDFSPYKPGAVEKIELKMSARSGHGSPCSITLRYDDEKIGDDFFKKMHRLVDELNGTSDQFPGLRSESRSARSGFGREFTDAAGGVHREGSDKRSNHVLAGGTSCVTIDGIAMENMASVLGKVARYLGNENLLSDYEAQRAQGALAEPIREAIAECETARVAYDENHKAQNTWQPRSALV